MVISECHQPVSIRTFQTFQAIMVFNRLAIADARQAKLRSKGMLRSEHKVLPCQQCASKLSKAIVAATESSQHDGQGRLSSVSTFSQGYVEVL